MPKIQFLSYKDYAILFSSILIIIILIITCLIVKKRRKEYYKKHEPILIDIKKKIDRMIPYFDKEERSRLSRLKIQPDIKSYTVNKHAMHLCVEKN